MNDEIDEENEQDSEAEDASDLAEPQAQLKAAPLKAGSRVGLIAPGSRAGSPMELKRSMDVVEEMGFVPLVGQNVMRNDGFCAGTDEERLDDFYTFLQDDSVDAILCVTGGYGALRLLPLLDFGHIRNNPKIFLGSGDNDAILLAINKLSGLVVFHASNIDEIDDKVTFDSIKSALTGSEGEKRVYCRNPGEPAFEGVAYSLNEKICDGIVCGGNLTALSSLFGTKYQPELQDKILLLDDFTERNSIMDRWFTTLYLADTLTKVSGIAFGGFPACSGRGSDNMLSIEDTFSDRLKDTGTPACFGFKFGLASKDSVMPIGIKAELDCAAGVIQYLEPALNF